MIGQKLAQSLIRSAKIGNLNITSLTLADAITPADIAERSSFLINKVVADITNPVAAASLVVDKPDLIFHLAAIVSGEAEANFEKGYAVNVEGVRNVLEGIRATGNGYKPKLVFTSSVAVYGGPYPDLIDDDFHLQPRTSYGAQKAIAELLVNDYTRKGFVDGISIRLPTICFCAVHLARALKHLACCSWVVLWLILVLQVAHTTAPWLVQPTHWPVFVTLPRVNWKCSKVATRT